jgi:septum formation protein
MAPLTDEEIASYVATGEPLDKAGAYGIQGFGGRLVQHVVGSYTGVVGLPLPSIYRLLREKGFTRLVEPGEAFRRWFADQGKDVPACTAP